MSSFDTPCVMAPALNWRAVMDGLVGAYADNTLRGYRADIAKLESWRLSRGEPLLPASPDTVAAFIADDARVSSSATLRRRLASIRKLHRLLRLPNPVDDEAVSIALRRALRAKRRRPKQALGLNADLRRRLIDACPADTLHGLRDRALIAVGYDSLCRRSELVGLLIEDLRPLPDGGARILVRRAKTDPFGDGRWAHLSPPTMDHLNAWLAAAAITDGPLLRPLIAGKVGAAPMNPVAVNRTLKTAARRAGLSEDVAASLSGHSMRIGAAQDLMRAGRDLLHIMTAGGWTSPTVVGGYVREAEVRVW